jgi:two-component sensor histidine kinase
VATQDVIYADDSRRRHEALLSPAPGDFAIAESNHRIANNLTLLVSSISLRAADVSRHPQRRYRSEDVTLMLSEIAARISSVAWLHRFLSEHPHTDCLNLNAHLHELCAGLVAALSDSDRVTLTRTGSGDCMLSSTEVIPVCLIVTEAVTNALKYAHPAGVHGRLSVGCHNDDDGALVVEVSDDGVGLPEGFDPSSGGGIGSRTIRVLARQLDAVAEYEPLPCGLTFRLRLPPR